MPVTVGFTVLLTLGLPIGWGTEGAPLPPPRPSTAPPPVLGVLTYPLADPGAGQAFLSLVLTLFWFFSIGGSLESELGSRRFATFLAIATVLEGLMLWGGSKAVGANVVVFGPGLPVAATTVAWGARNSKAVVRLWGLLPVSGLVIVLLTVGIVLFGYGTGNPALGFIAAIPLGLAFAWAADRLPGLPYRPAVQKISKQQLAQEREYYDDVKRREQKRAEEERLRKLLGE